MAKMSLLSLSGSVLIKTTLMKHLADGEMLRRSKFSELIHF